VSFVRAEENRVDTKSGPKYTRRTVLHLADNLKLPKNVVTQTIGFLGRKGSGKTYGAMKLAEGLLGAGAQIIAFDPMGVWHGLRSSRSGKSGGFDIPVLGGFCGDIDLESEGGSIIADFIVDTGTSVVLDVIKMRKQQRVRFATDFAERLYQRQSRTRTPLHLFLEEAHLFVPQDGDNRDPKMLGAFEDLIRLGRAAGIGVSMISQRPQSVSKNALNQTELLFAFQMTGPHERKAIKEWITSQGADLGLYERLPELGVGEAICWSPSWLKFLGLVKIRERTTFDASSTPELGGKQQNIKRAKVDLTRISQLMAESIERTQASDPKLLKKQITALERRLLEAGDRIAELEARAEVDTKPPVDLDRLSALQSDMTYLVGDARQILGDIAKEIGKIETIKAAAEPGRDKRARDPLIVTQKPILARATDPQAGGDLPGKAYDMVGWTALAGERGIDRQRLALLCGMTPRSGTFTSYVSKAKSGGYVSIEGNRLRVTSAGKTRANGSFVAWPSSDELFAQWLGAFPGKAQDMFRVIYEHPDGIDRGDVAEAVGMSERSGTFTSYLSKLCSKNVVVKSGRILLPAAEILDPRP